MSFFKKLPERIINLPMWNIVFKRKNSSIVLTRKTKTKKEANVEKKLIEEDDRLEFVEMIQTKVVKNKKQK
jgi:hypothetical protein